MTTTMYNGYAIDTTECDKYHRAATAPVEGAFEAFFAWLKAQDIELVMMDTRERYIGFGDHFEEVPVSDSILRMVADRELEGETALTSQELGAILDAWGEEGWHRCVFRYQRCPWPKTTEWDEVRRKHVIVTYRAEWVADARSTERLLADYYGIDMRARDREQAAILATYRKPAKVAP